MKVGDWARPQSDFMPFGNTRWGAGRIEEIFPGSLAKVRYASTPSDPSYGHHDHLIKDLVIVDRFGTKILSS